MDGRLLANIAHDPLQGGGVVKKRSVFVAIAASAGLLLLAAACGGGSTGSGWSSGSVQVTEKDFTVAGPPSIQSGAVTFSIQNDGPSVHEFVIMKTDVATPSLPTTTEDGQKVLDEESSELQAVDEAEDIAPGTTASLPVTLAPGNYIMFCNIAGHYAQGMISSFSVSG